MAIVYSVIGRHIREARVRKGLTQETAAELLGISLSYYGSIERGTYEVNLDRLSDISVKFEVPIESLVAGCLEGAPVFLPVSANNVCRRLEELMRGCDESTAELIYTLAKDVITHSQK